VYRYGLAFALATLRQPGRKAFGEPLGSEAETGFDLAIGDGKRVVKIGGVCEIAHAELIEPIERAGARLSANDYIDVEFLGVHAEFIAPNMLGGDGSIALRLARISRTKKISQE